MKAWVRLGMLVVTAAWAGAPEERFSEAIPPAAFSAAGLTKLSPEELARLDALVRDFHTGALAAAQRELESARARAAKAEADARAADAAAKSRVAEVERKSGPGLLERAKVLLKPGTRIEYTTLESRLATEFRGWEKHTVFQLENGQRWRAVGDSTYVTSPMPAPNVKIVPGALGSFWMHIEGIRQRVRVESLDATR